MKGFVFIIGLAVVGSVMGAGTATLTSTTNTPEATSTVETSEDMTPMPPIVDH